MSDPTSGSPLKDSPEKTRNLSITAKQKVGKVIQELILCSSGEVNPTQDYIAAREALLDFISELEADRARLDWLEANTEEMENIENVYIFGEKTLREIIDVARSFNQLPQTPKRESENG
jgi:hypothetical protein